jgi:hypothetical protein
VKTEVWAWLDGGTEGKALVRADRTFGFGRRGRDLMNQTCSPDDTAGEEKTESTVFAFDFENAHPAHSVNLLGEVYLKLTVYEADREVYSVKTNTMKVCCSAFVCAAAAAPSCICLLCMQWVPADALCDRDQFRNYKHRHIQIPSKVSRIPETLDCLAARTDMLEDRVRAQLARKQLAAPAAAHGKEGKEAAAARTRARQAAAGRERRARREDGPSPEIADGAQAAGVRCAATASRLATRLPIQAYFRRYVRGPVAIPVPIPVLSYAFCRSQSRPRSPTSLFCPTQAATCSYAVSAVKPMRNGSTHADSWATTPSACLLRCRSGRPKAPKQPCL